MFDFIDKYLRNRNYQIVSLKKSMFVNKWYKGENLHKNIIGSIYDENILIMIIFKKKLLKVIIINVHFC